MGRPRFGQVGSHLWSRRYATTVAAYDATADETKLVPRNRLRAVIARHDHLDGQLPIRLVAPSRRLDRG